MSEIVSYYSPDITIFGIVATNQFRSVSSSLYKSKPDSHNQPKIIIYVLEVEAAFLGTFISER